MSSKRTDASQVNVGDYLSETQYYKVIGISASKINVENERGFKFNVSKNIVEEGMYSAGQFTQTKKLPRSKVVEVLESANAIFTVNFNKLATDKTIAAKLNNVPLSTFGDPSELKKLSKELVLGEERTLIGYLQQTEPKLGRTKVVDLEVPSGEYNSRLVDHRTLNWLIYKNVKYIVK